MKQRHIYLGDKNRIYATVHKYIINPVDQNSIIKNLTIGQLFATTEYCT